MQWQISKFTFSCTLILLFSASVSAQVAETVDKDQVQAEPVAVKNVEKASVKPAKKIKAKSSSSADDYHASEEISEDLSVSYPVDI